MHTSNKKSRNHIGDSAKLWVSFPGFFLSSRDCHSPNPSRVTRFILSYTKLKYAFISQACPSIEEILRLMWSFYKEGIGKMHTEKESLTPDY